MKAGVSRAEITPPAGMKMGGYAARYKGSKGVHDPLHSRALYIKGKEESVLLLSNDLLSIPDSIAGEVKEELASRTELKEDGILSAATHTHSGPSSPPDISPDIPSVGVENYLDLLPEKLISVALKSMEGARKAKLGWGIGKATISFNRRVDNGPLDPDVGTLLVVDDSNRAIASLVNYACHGVVLGDRNYLISADYPGAVSRRIESEFGSNHVSLFTNGTTGDLSPISSKGGACARTFDMVERLGGIVANAALATMRLIELSEEPIIRCATRKVALSLVKPSEEEAIGFIEKQKKTVEDLRSKNVPADDIRREEAILWYYEKNLDLVQKGLPEERIEINLQALRIGNAVLVGIPAEPLVEVGLRIKARSVIKPTFTIAYANGYYGYMPTSEAYERGGYEATPMWWNRLSRGSAEIVVEESLSLAKGLR